MFRARIIENQNYYVLRRKLLLYLLLPIVPMGFMANFFHFPAWLTVLMIVGYIAAFVLKIRHQKQMEASAGDSWLEIEKSTIRIKTKAGELKEEIKFDEVRQITLQEEYALPQESFKAVKDELLGDQQRNEMVLHLAAEQRRICFEVDSYFNMVQFQQLIDYWKQAGIVQTTVAA